MGRSKGLSETSGRAGLRGASESGGGEWGEEGEELSGVGGGGLWGCRSSAKKSGSEKGLPIIKGVVAVGLAHGIHSVLRMCTVVPTRVGLA